MADITGILLAAGCSQRFGSNKLLAPVHGQPMIQSSLLALAPCDNILVVVRPGDVELKSYINKTGQVSYVDNHSPERGMGYSIRTGIESSENSNGWCIMPADMPFVSADITLQLVVALHAGASLVAPFYQGQRGHPVGFSHQFRSNLLLLDGDIGARDILNENKDRIQQIEVLSDSVLRDIDTPADLP